MKQYYVTDTNGEVLGPFDEQYIRDRHAAGVFSKATRICAVGSQEWVSIMSILPPPPAPEPEPTGIDGIFYKLGQLSYPIVSTCWPIRFEGRLARKPYWMCILAMVIAHIVVMILTGILQITELTAALASILNLVWMVFLIVINVGIGCRRLHDLGLSGWLQLLGLIPFIGAIILLVLCAQPGKPGDNAYGPQPQD